MFFISIKLWHLEHSSNVSALKISPLEELCIQSCIAKMLWWVWLQCLLCCCVIFTNIDEVGSVLTGHTKTEIPPEPRVFLDHLRGKEVQVLQSLWRKSAQHTYEVLQHESFCVLWICTPSSWRGEIFLNLLQQCSTTLSMRFSTSGLQTFQERKGRRKIWLECYQLLLHRWDVFKASIDQSGIVLAEQHWVEHLFTWDREK